MFDFSASAFEMMKFSFGRAIAVLTYLKDAASAVSDALSVSPDSVPALPHDERHSIAAQSRDNHVMRLMYMASKNLSIIICLSIFTSAAGNYMPAALVTIIYVLSGTKGRR